MGLSGDCFTASQKTTEVINTNVVINDAQVIRCRNCRRDIKELIINSGSLTSYPIVIDLISKKPMSESLK